MKFKKCFLIISVGLLASSCSYSKEQPTDSVTKNQILTQKNVTICDVKKIQINFCKEEKISIYNRHLKDEPNFSKNLTLIVMDQNRDIEKGVGRNVKSFVVLDPIKKQVIPFPQVVGNFVDDRLQILDNEPALIKFSKKNNEVCISGTTYASDDNNINVENECYRLENGKFIKKDNSKVSVENTKKVQVVYNSKKHFKCLTNSNLKECSGLELVNSKEMLKHFDFINPSDGAAVIINRGDYDLVISPFEDESGPNLRLMKVTNNKLIDEKFISADKQVEVNNNLQVTYFDGDKKQIIEY